MQQDPQGISGFVWILQDLSQGLANQRRGTVQLHITANQHKAYGNMHKDERFSAIKSADKKIITVARCVYDHGLTCPVGRMRELLAALKRFHGVGEGGAGFCAVQQGCVESMNEHFGGSYGDRPQRHQHTLSTCS